MLSITGNRLFDVLIVFVVVYCLTELFTWIFKKYFIKDSSKPIGGVYESSKNNSHNK